MGLEIARRLVGGVWRTDAENEGGAAPGGSVPGSVRRLTVDVAAADLAEGPTTLYTPSAGEIIGPVYLYDVVFVNSGLEIMIGRPEWVPGDTSYPQLAVWDSDLSRDGAHMSPSGNLLAQIPLTTGEVTAGFGDGGDFANDAYTQPWAQGVYSQFDHIIAAGHIWEADPGGASGAVKPDFAGNIGGSVVDGDITWNDWGDATVGSAIVSFDVCVPDAA